MVEYLCVVKVLLLTFCFYSINGFNLSPKPNLSLREPNFKTFRNKSRSSYFGFVINLRESSIFVSAPRAQSTLESQRHNNETGAIYKCSIANADCEPFFFDKTGDINDEGLGDTYDSEKKDYQWLGAAMDGGSKDTDILVVCAPRLIAIDETDEILMNGICYWIPNTTDKSDNIAEITPLRVVSSQSIEIENSNSINYYVFGEQGLSVHVTTNNEKIIMGAPGIYDWKGSVILYHHPEMTGTAPEINYTTVVPDPNLWNQENHSYFGYSVGSGYFDSALPNKTYYVASAPQAIDQSGEVYIFDIVENPSGENHTIKKLHTFAGSQFGEYFGYAVLAEDFNGDALTDLIITAPLYSSDGRVEQGAIYVFINKGKFTFECQKIIKSPVKGIGRFGTSISKLGDINRDGFNDIAVGAPFAGDGTVFIYLGCSKGLRERNSQQLSAVPIASSWGQQMFGHGLSKGADIDNNGFNDFAIGAPNAESVFVYRAYPVVKILATIKSLSREIVREQKSFKIEICYRISTESQNIRSQNLTIQVKVDKRVTLAQTNSNELTFNSEATTENQCRLLDANIKFEVVDKAIELEMNYQLFERIPISEKFCDTCAAVDPADPEASFDKIVFTSGCKNNVCIFDLKVTSSGVGATITLGHNKTISVTYEVTNSGDIAFLPEINITSSNKMPFQKIPPTCDQHKDFLLCALNRGQPMLNNSQENITIVYDVSGIEGSSINLTASVNCTGGHEKDPSDNVVLDFIVLQEFSIIEVNAKSNITTIDLDKAFNNSTEIIKIYELKNKGPSKIQDLEITFEIPIAHKFYGSTQSVPVIDVNSITVQCVYNSQLLFADLYQNTTLLLVNPTEKETLEKDPKKIYKAGAHTNNEQAVHNNEYIRAAQKKLQELHSRELLGLVRINRTIVFSCINPEMTECARAVIKVNNFIPDTPINITIKYNVDLNEVNKTLIEPWQFFVIFTKIDIFKIGDLDGKTTNITGNLEFIDATISKHQFYDVSIPLWVIFFSGLIGLLILAVMSYGMQKVGFFKRKTREEMQKCCVLKKNTADWINEMGKEVEKQEEGEDTAIFTIETVGMGHKSKASKFPNF